MKLLTFQKRFLRSLADADTACLSLPRGNGKSWLAGKIAADAMQTVEAHHEIVVVAASVNQGRIVFRFARQMLGEAGWRYMDSAQRLEATRKDGAKLRVIGSNGRTAMGLVNVPLVIADEPGAWEVIGGTLLHDAIETAQGKPGSPLKSIYIGTLAPATGGWWHDLVRGGDQPGIRVHVLQGDRKRWRDLRHVFAINPLSRIDAKFRQKLRRERDQALRDERLKARFLSYRLNLPTAEESTVLLTVEDWEAMSLRPVGEKDGRPFVGVDLGGGRAWSAAVAIFPSGRIEALAVAPGIPSLEEQEKRDLVPSGLYRKIAETGRLTIAEGHRVPPVVMLTDWITAAWGRPREIICDRHRLGELLDCRLPCRVSPRIPRWQESSEDIRATRKMVLDEGASVEPASDLILAASIAEAVVKNEDSGSMRLVKKGSNNTGRDDVAVALSLAGGAWMRERRKPARRNGAYLGTT